MKILTPFFSIGIFFLLIGGGFFALTLRKAAPISANPKKSELREQAVLVAETKKMRLAAGILATLGVVFMALS